MSEDEIRNYLAKQKSPVPTPRVRPRPVRRRPPQEAQTFRDFSATHLFCAHCKKAMPVREKLLLVLPGGDLYDYLCTGCGTSLGTRRT